jgi:peptide/nickel transport system substrate-binding protein
VGRSGHGGWLRPVRQLVENLKLRQAVQYAIDREAVAKVLGQSIGAPMYSFLTPGYLGYDQNVPHHTFDTARAKQLLADAGYPNGIDIQLSTINRAVDQQQAQILKQMLGDVGIRVNLDVLERIAWTDKMATGQYEMGTFFTTMRPDPDSILAGRFQSKQGKNYAQMSDPVMDQLLVKGRSSYDDAVRSAAYREVQQRIFDTAWYGTIWYRKYFDGYRKRVQGRMPTQEPNWNLRTAWLAA